MMSGGISTFNCVVYFVRSADSEEIIWGTDSPIQVRDKVWGVRTEARVRGAYKVRIINPGKFLEKLVGNNVFYQEQIDLNKYFRMELQGKIKAAVSKFLNSMEQELIGIDAYLDELSDKVEPYIDESLSDYGLKCVKFTLSGLDIDTQKYDQLDQSQIELISRTRGFQGDKAGLEILGNDWTRVQGVNVLSDLANNPGAGGVAAAGVGVGLGVGAAGAFGSIAQQVFAPVNNGFAQQPVQGAPAGMYAQAPQGGQYQQTPGVQGQYQQAPGIQQQAPAEDPLATLQKLKSLLDAGLITQSEYDSKKAEILSRM